jgi:hypothetical protein
MGKGSSKKMSVVGQASKLAQGCGLRPVLRGSLQCLQFMNRAAAAVSGGLML